MEAATGFGGKTVFVDGHTRALAAYMYGVRRIPVYWECEDLDCEECLICVGRCDRVDIRTTADLEDKMVTAGAYRVLWLDRCAMMCLELEARREREPEPRGSCEDRCGAGGDGNVLS